MRDPIVIIGIGQMGGVFARAFLSAGHPVYPILRSTPVNNVVEKIPDPAFVLVAVGMKDLHPVLDDLPIKWHDRLGLLQNELLPRDWEAHGIRNPTVMVVWFEKKYRSPLKPLIPSPIFGPQAQLLTQSLQTINLPTRILEDGPELTRQLVLKNLYILTANIAGLVADQNIGKLLKEHTMLVSAVFDDVLALQESLTGQSFDCAQMWEEVRQIFNAFPEQSAQGRSARERLQRAMHIASEYGIAVPQLRSISEMQLGQ
jgi:ketopantoate reductase